MPYHEVTYCVDVVWQPMSSKHQSNNKQDLRCFPVFEAIYIRLVGMKYSLVVEIKKVTVSPFFMWKYTYICLKKVMPKLQHYVEVCLSIYCNLTIIKSL